MQPAQQPSLFDVPASPPLGRHEVPVRAHYRTVSLSAAPQTLPYAPGSETSREAAEKAAGRKNEQEAAVTLLLARHGGGLTDEQIGKWLASSMQASSARRARIMLTKEGRVKNTGRTRLSSFNRNVTVWEAAR